MKKWLGSEPKECDLCHRDLSKQKYFIDGKTQMGPWALMCTSCHKINGCGLGLGRGQKYEVKTLKKVGG